MDANIESCCQIELKTLSLKMFKSLVRKHFDPISQVVFREITKMFVTVSRNRSTSSEDRDTSEEGFDNAAIHHVLYQCPESNNLPPAAEHRLRANHVAGIIPVTRVPVAYSDDFIAAWRNAAELALPERAPAEVFHPPAQ